MILHKDRFFCLAILIIFLFSFFLYLQKIIFFKNNNNIFLFLKKFMLFVNLLEIITKNNSRSRNLLNRLIKILINQII